MSDIEAVLGAIDQDLEASLARWMELLRIPSISTDPEYADRVPARRAWLVDELNGIGFEAAARDTAGHPMVTARSGPAATKTPRVLFYGHYDVQPADPLDKWTTPPFDPVRRKDSDGVERIYARGAADDKGQLMTFVEAARAWVKINGRLPVETTICWRVKRSRARPVWRRFSKPTRANSRPTWRWCATPTCGTTRPRRSPRGCAALFMTR
jgi:acetylornithine deacetylase/succinyl-diaminopimelate desuccinylase-like protein